jgi:hypothetical protein
MGIQLTIDAPGGASGIAGFKYWWGKYVNGFAEATHCGACLKGSYSRRIRKDMPTGRVVQLDELASGTYDYIYLCGVRDKAYAGNEKVAKGYEDNFHLVLKPSPRSHVVKATYNGLVVTVAGAAEVPITPLPDGWHGLALKYTSCRNFQFGVQGYGVASEGSALASR